MMDKSWRDNAYFARLWAQLEKPAGDDARRLARAIYVSNTTHDWESQKEAWGEIYALLPKGALDSIDSLLAEPLLGAIDLLAGRQNRTTMVDILRLRARGQFSGTAHRRSYRSISMKPYLPQLLDAVWREAVWQSRERTLSQAMAEGQHGTTGFINRLAAALAAGDAEATGYVRTAIMGDATEALLSRQIIRAVILSGAQQPVE